MKANAVCRLTLDMPTLPFNVVLSFEPLFAYLRRTAADTNNVYAHTASYILSRTDHIQALHEPVTNIQKLRNKYETEIDLLMMTYASPASSEFVIGMSHAPFSFDSIYETPAYRNTLDLTKKKLTFTNTLNATPETVLMHMKQHAYTLIINKFYNSSFSMDKPFLVKMTDRETGLDDYFRMNINATMTDIVCHGTLPSLSDDDVQMLLSKSDNMDVWQKMLPIEMFEFTGIIFTALVSITDQYIMSLLKSDLLNKDALISPERFMDLQQKLRSLLRIPDLQLGLAGFNTRLKRMNVQSNIWQSLLRDTDRVCMSYVNTTYAQTMTRGEKLIVNDLRQVSPQTPIEELLISKNIINFCIIPLLHEGNPVGFIELGSSHVAALNVLSIGRMYEVFPIFAVALKRATDELEARIQAAIKENCTAIHPSVEWRFVEAAANMLYSQENGISTDMENITFADVYPLYGATDIRGSSHERNIAIQADLIEHLELAQEVLHKAVSVQALPVLDQVLSELETMLLRVKKGLHSGDEVAVLDFIHNEVETLFEPLAKRYADIVPAWDKYKSQMDKDLKILYRRRRDFEESLMTINETVSTFIEAEQDMAQAMFPHYFEKYKTDGIEYNMYIGASLQQNGLFDHIYLDNIRLWQLINMCDITRRTRELLPQLKVPLQTTQLILVHGSPLSIKFRFDEKQFDVDGAYNIRYEIIKKRIDKALIKGTDERLTQPGKIAIIYTQPKEQKEYERYLTYLQQRGYIKPEIEHLELEDLQGVHGLKALRVTVVVE